ncbi:MULTISPECIES: hypothetical protein [Malaciobacter]|jgi:cellulose synthase/poly-beta-1,6-N-acetylglucosamine synthase-like glycosyltransferase|uniref:Uncharacterized protein n=2 Tax=Malaciobacter TaxID=2321114 RepID=A0AB36ZSQ1_9BACT|nr:MULTISPECIES: hypothetical protein [Malaciobacter]PHO09507.1 hypothetical protein CPG37_09535 [Malaciobacter canalis]PPK57557.1 hypothetical protein B0F89_1472 [Malaciobacter marinus]QEE33634.1 hypothetical protein ACAN_2184 [Malaciobacter canalis]SKB83311.1 hypothetical protein SAMN06295997_1582 [Malaciobacter marinus]
MFVTKHEVIENIEQVKKELQQMKYKKTLKYSKPLLDMLNKFHIALQNDSKDTAEIIEKYNNWYKELELNKQLDRLNIYEKMQEFK